MPSEIENKLNIVQFGHAIRIKKLFNDLKLKERGAAVDSLFRSYKRAVKKYKIYRLDLPEFFWTERAVPGMNPVIAWKCSGSLKRGGSSA